MYVYLSCYLFINIYVFLSSVVSFSLLTLLLLVESLALETGVLCPAGPRDATVQQRRVGQRPSRLSGLGFWVQGLGFRV